MQNIDFDRVWAVLIPLYAAAAACAGAGTQAGTQAGNKAGKQAVAHPSTQARVQSRNLQTLFAGNDPGNQS